MLKEILIANHDFMIILAGTSYYFQHHEGSIFRYTTNLAIGVQVWYYNMETNAFGPDPSSLPERTSFKDNYSKKSIRAAYKKYLFQKQLKEVLNEG